jgi:hypothetical protein
MSLVSAKQLKTETGISVPTIRAACLRGGLAQTDGLYDHDAAGVYVRLHSGNRRVMIVKAISLRQSTA